MGSRPRQKGLARRRTLTVRADASVHGADVQNSDVSASDLAAVQPSAAGSGRPPGPRGTVDVDRCTRRVRLRSHEPGDLRFSEPGAGVTAPIWLGAPAGVLEERSPPGRDLHPSYIDHQEW